jgi:hypothetical protein
MRRRIPPDPHAYHRIYRTWPTPASKHEPLKFGPPYGHPKFPPINWHQDWPLLLFVTGMLAISAMLKILRGELSR